MKGNKNKQLFNNGARIVMILYVNSALYAELDLARNRESTGQVVGELDSHSKTRYNAPVE